MSLDFPFLIQETRRRIVGWDKADIAYDTIEKGGSDRVYCRLKASGRARGPASIILMVYTDRRPDNLSFFAATEVLRHHDVRTPRIYFHDPVARLCWLEDLGSVDLWQFRSGCPDERRPLYQDALMQAAKIHALRLEHVSEPLRQQLQPGFDETLYLCEQDYFFDNFARHFSALSPDAVATIRRNAQFRETAAALAEMPRFLVHRDFQSQNIMIRDGKTWLIDYQGLRPGRPEYDLASLLYDPYVSLTQEEREDLAEFYFENRPRDDRWDTNPDIFAACCCQRLMQALGAYAFLGHERGKTHFFAHIPNAVANLKAILADRNILPGLADVLELRQDAEEVAVA